MTATTAPFAGAAAAAALDVARSLARRASPRGLLVALAVVALAALFAAAFAPILGAPMPTRLARIAANAITAAAILIAVVIADEAVDRGAPRLPAYAIALLAGAVIGAFVGSPLREALGLRFAFQGKVPEAAFDGFTRLHRLDQILLGILIGGLATFVHVNRRTALAARRRQHDAERARARAQRRTLESQLQALQARVEPVFLFDTLARIRALYREDAGAAGAMLDDLIVYLRAALPHLRESTSTLAQEATLARSWLEIVGRAAGGWQVEVAVAAEVQDARVPALLLLPLVQRAVADAGSGGLRLRIAAQAWGGRLRVEVATSTAAFAAGIAGEPMLAQIEARLRALHGADAAFEVGRRADAEGRRAVLTLPFETAAVAEDRGGQP